MTIRLKWNYSSIGSGTYEAEILRNYGPGQWSKFEAVILAGDKPMAYVSTPDDTIWAGKMFSSVDSAKRWASRTLKMEAGVR